LVVIGIDRYIAIVHPFFYEDRFTDTVVNRMLFAVWTLGILLGLLYSMWATTADSVPCVVRPNVVPSLTSLVIDGGQYLLTSIFLIVVYTKILRIALSHHKKIGTAERSETVQGAQQTKQRVRQFKAVFLTAVIVGVFVVLWFPYALNSLFVYIGVTTAASSFNDISTGLGMFNFSFNWILFGVASKSYQKAYINLFKKCCGLQQPIGPVE